MDEPKGSIERLKGVLYSKTGLQKHRARRTLRSWGSGVEDVPKEWSDADEPVIIPPALFPGLSNRSPSSLILVGSIVFFFLCAAVAAFFYFFGGNLISNRNIDIGVTGPVSIAGGQELVLQVTIANRNSVPIELADFIVEYPKGARPANNLSLELGRTRESIGTINPGERVSRTVRGVLFGKEGEGQTIQMTLEYRIEGSNAIFYKDQEYEVLLSSSPLAVVVEGLSEVIDGQETEFTIEVISNSPNAIENAMLKAEYPFGFSVASSEPKASYGSNVWYLGTILPGERKRIVMRGRMFGQNTEERVFRFAAGIQSSKNEQELATTFGTLIESVTISRPFVSVALSVNGSTGTEFVVPPAKQVSVDLEWTNNLSAQILDPELSVKIRGNSFNELNVRPQNGFYNSLDDTIRWNKETVDKLDVLSPGERVNVGFQLTPLDRVGGVFLDNPSIAFDITIKGRRLGESGVPEVIESTTVAAIKVASDLRLASRSVYSVGPLPNTGPIPPQAEVETTYTIIWTLTNGANNVTNGKVSATLPSYMRFVGTQSPEGERLTYNPVSRLITWEVGNVLSESGYQKAPEEVAFQVALIPSTSQIGNRVDLLGVPTFTGLDQYTGKEIQSQAKAVSTTLTTDPGVPERHDTVIP